ncbi:MAG: CcdB family protein [Methylobacter sp.]|nr:CcdB family protein [Methylobacter sp.]
MAQFDVFRNNGEHAEVTPYFLDIQSDLLQGLETRVVVPLRRRDHFPVASLPTNLTPTFEIEGIECLLETPKLAAVPLRLLKIPVASLASSQFIITEALDFLFHGY